jgi:catechol 2,3-dioxygenase-like lactoylglutathione lyase family enzyme
MPSLLLSDARMHHVALRVDDAKASKAWFMATLDFCVSREFSFGGMEFVFLHPAGSEAPVIEIIGGGPVNSHPPYEGTFESLKRPGLHHLCLEVTDLDQVMVELRRRDARILLDIVDGPPGSGVAKAACIADPWENVIELLQTA